jgi:hypothetical protein
VVHLRCGAEGVAFQARETFATRGWFPEAVLANGGPGHGWCRAAMRRPAGPGPSTLSRITITSAPARRSEPGCGQPGWLSAPFAGFALLVSGLEEDAQERTLREEVR